MEHPGLPTCCICASVLVHPHECEHVPYHDNIQQPCCHRFFCGKCIDKNPRFMNYCPYCQTPIFGTGKLQDFFSALPPSYPPPVRSPPPAYTAAVHPWQDARTIIDTPGITHHLRPEDTLMSLSLLYNTPASLIRAHNSIYSDHLLPALHVVFIPHTQFYQGPSLSPHPHEDPKTVARKAMVKRFQLKAKCVDPKLVQWYLQECNWDEHEAIRRWNEDEEWERRNPLPLGVQSGKRGSRRRGWETSPVGSDWLSGYLRQLLENEEQRKNKEAKSRRRWGLLGLGSVMG